MQKIVPGLYSSDEGSELKRVRTNSLILNAVSSHCDKLMEILRKQVITDNKIPDEEFETLKHFLKFQLVVVISDLMKKHTPKLAKAQRKLPIEEISNIQPPASKDLPEDRSYNIYVHVAPPFPSRKELNNYKLMLNYQIENVFMLPLFILALTKRNKDNTIISAKTVIQSLMQEVDELLHYKKIVVAPGSPREEFILLYVDARNKVKQTSARITIKAIAEELNMDRRDFYDKCSSHKIMPDRNKNFNLIDTTTGKEI